MKLHGTGTDILNVLTGKTAVQTQSALSVDPQTQQWITLMAIGAGALLVLMFMPGRR